MTTTITIREQTRQETTKAATIQFGGGAPYDISVSDPFSPEQEKRLEWYFERWLKFPFTDQVPAERAAASIRTYGEALFGQLFRANPDVYLEYQQVRAGGVALEIVGSPEFHTLHWEALWDPNQERPLAVESLIVRKNAQPVSYRAAIKPAPQLRVLLVTARPAGVRDVSYRTISRPLVEALEEGDIAAQIDIVRPGSLAALVDHLEDSFDTHGNGYYHIIHLDMHGALLTYEQYQKLPESHSLNPETFRSDNYAQEEVTAYEGQRAFLFFDEANSRSETGGKPVAADDLARLLNMRQIPIVVLNACQSGKQVGTEETSLGSRLLGAGVQLVVAMGYSVTVSAARLLMTTLYRELLAGKTAAQAIRRARLELYHDKKRQAAFGQQIGLEDWVLPVIYQNRAPKFAAEAFRGGTTTLTTVYRPPRLTYGFVGRDVDILQIERHLLQRRNILLLRGMGGAGKTTLLHHLGWWWQKTRFVEQVFYFGYDAKAYHLPELVQSIGERLQLSLSGRQWDDEAAVLRQLKRRRHLLILDNLESVTAERLSIPNTLNTEAQGEVRRFLQELVNAKTVMLLGSRGGEDWLRPDPLREQDVYELPGLDYVAQTELAEAILQGVEAPHYPEMEEHQADFRRLLKLLGGYPLAMEVVLANLREDTPAEVIARLQAADIDLEDASEAATKTESILKCIDYSHSNLSEDAQALLLCLAPFTGVFNLTWLEQYTAQLKAQTELAHLPYDQWQTVLQEAVNWGLLQPHEQLDETGYLRIQPIFPYFLKTRLNDTTQTVTNNAIKAAFCQHYDEIGSVLGQAMKAKEAQSKQVGQLLISTEYENLMTTVETALISRTRFFGAYEALVQSLSLQQNHQAAIDLSQKILLAQDGYDQKQLDSEIGKHFYWVLAKLANSQLGIKNYKEARVTYNHSLEVLRNSKAFTRDAKAKNTAIVYQQLGSLTLEQRQWDSAKRYLKKALQIKINLNDRFSQAITLHHLGSVALEQQQLDNAEHYFKEALQIYIDFDERFPQAETLHQLGIVAQQQQRWGPAECYFKGALQIKVDFDDYFSQASTLHHLGNVAQLQEHWDIAYRYYKEALQIKISFNDRFSQAVTLHQLGIVAQQQRQWVAAERYYKDALQIYIDFNERYEQAKTLGQLGLLAEAKGETVEAVRYSLQTAVIFAKYEDFYSLSIALRALARLRQATGVGDIVAQLAEALDVSVGEAEQLLDEAAGD